MIACRVLKNFPWRGAYYAEGREITPNATIRALFLRRGLVEVIGEEAVAAKEAKAESEAKAKRGRPRKVATV